MSLNTFKYRRYTRTAVSGKFSESIKARYLGQILPCCVIGNALKERSKRLRVLETNR